MSHQRILVRSAAEREDELVAQLWRHGTVGVEIRPAGDGLILVEAYFTGEAPPELSPVAGSIVESGPAPSTDWLAVWRAAARPLPVGRRFLLDPREIDAAPAERQGRILLRLPARAAFGTGSHESTRLVLEMMERIDFPRRRVLDVGTGTGVLAFAALALGARSAVAFDLDVVAPLLAAQNAALNELHPAFFAGGLAALAGRPRFGVALVNVIPEEIRDGLPALRALLLPGGLAVFSGILRERGRAELATLRRAGFRRVRSRVAGEWVAYLTERVP
jgi:ribosomal protein L11 methyltransferase